MLERILNVLLEGAILYYVAQEYYESKTGNQLLKKLLRSRKRSTAKAIIKEVLNPQ